jgi:hypothetical protein
MVDRRVMRGLRNSGLEGRGGCMGHDGSEEWARAKAKGLEVFEKSTW